MCNTHTHTDDSTQSSLCVSRFKGQKKGGVTENASYYIFTQCPDGAFEAFPVHAWYNFTPVAKHRTLTAEEAEEEWGRYVTPKRVSTFTSCPRGSQRMISNGLRKDKEGIYLST